MQNANFSRLGLTDANGLLVERYEYTPYGQRLVFTMAGTNDPLARSPLWDSARVSGGGVTQPYALCDIGHQGVLHDKEFDLLAVRNRYSQPRTGRWIQRDKEEYAEGMSLFEYARSTPIGRRDPLGNRSSRIPSWARQWPRVKSFPKCGLCCVGDVRFAKTSQAPKRHTTLAGGYGFPFDVSISLAYVFRPAKPYTDCTLEWWEYGTVPVVEPGGTDDWGNRLADKTVVPAHRWVDVLPRLSTTTPENKFFKSWRESRVDLGKTDTITIWDKPGTSSLRPAQHIRWFAIRAKCSPNAGAWCKVPEKAIYAVMLLNLTKPGISSGYFGPDLAGSPRMSTSRFSIRSRQREQECDWERTGLRHRRGVIVTHPGP